MLAAAVKKKKRSKELAMLGALPASDRDTATRQRRLAKTTGSPHHVSHHGSPHLCAITPTAQGNNEMGADGTPCDYEEEEDKENETPVVEAPPPPPPEKLAPFLSPLPAEGKGEHSFQAIDPVNVLIPMNPFKECIENTMICPQYKGSCLEVGQKMYGFATEVSIKCKGCSWSTEFAPTKVEKETPTATPNKKPSKERDSENFHKCPVNYLAGLLMQKMGVGYATLDMMFAFLGIAPNHGSDAKWNRIMDVIGKAKHMVADECMDENLAIELELTRIVADEEILDWLDSDKGKAASQEEVEEKRNRLLHQERNKIGIYMSADGAWQKRKIGKGSGDSTTGHNYALGGYSQLILGAKSFSQHCRIHEVAAKAERDPKDHRCPKNFPMELSAKMMEPIGTVNHCIRINRSEHNAYVHTLITDDDSTTKANCKYSFVDEIEAKFPGTKNAEGKIPSRQKHAKGWPTMGNVVGAKLMPKDYGRMPLWCICPHLILADPNHRVRSVGNAFYKCRVKGKEALTKNDRVLGKDECENQKKSSGHYLAKNQGWLDEDFERKGACVVYHLFNDHHLCDEYWCTALQAAKESDPERKKEIDDQRKHRPTNTPAKIKLFERVKTQVLPLLTAEKMRMCHHRFQTQKNEALQRKCTAVLPKDRFYGGSMQIHDLIRLVVVMDSLGEHKGLNRLCHDLGLPYLHPVLSLWADRKDTEDKYKHTYRQKIEVKRRRITDRVNKMKEGMRKDKKASAEGCTYETGVANDLEEPTATTATATTTTIIPTTEATTTTATAAAASKGKGKWKSTGATTGNKRAKKSKGKEAATRKGAGPTECAKK